MALAPTPPRLPTTLLEFDHSMSRHAITDIILTLRHVKPVVLNGRITRSPATCSIVCVLEFDFVRASAAPLVRSRIRP